MIPEFAIVNDFGRTTVCFMVIIPSGRLYCSSIPTGNWSVISG